MLNLSQPLPIIEGLLPSEKTAPLTLTQLKAALKPIITRLDGIDTKLKEIDRKLVSMNVRINNAPRLAYNMSATPLHQRINFGS
jgi:hypothetical protein